MRDLFDPSEIEYLLDIASEYLVGPKNVMRDKPNGPPNSLYADEHLQHYSGKLPVIFAKLFARGRCDLELTRLRHTLGEVFRVELEIINWAQTVDLNGASFHPMLWFQFDTRRNGRAMMRLGFRLSDAPEGVLIEVEGRDRQAIPPHRLPSWWNPAGYASIASAFRQDLNRLAQTDLTEDDMICDVQRLAYTSTDPGIFGIPEAIANHGANAYAFLRMLMREGSAQINASVFEQLLEGGEEPFDDQQIGEWQETAGGYLRYWADQQTEDHQP